MADFDEIENMSVMRTERDSIRTVLLDLKSDNMQVPDGLAISSAVNTPCNRVFMLCLRTTLTLSATRMFVRHVLQRVSLAMLADDVRDFVALIEGYYRVCVDKTRTLLDDDASTAATGADSSTAERKRSELLHCLLCYVHAVWRLYMRVAHKHWVVSAAELCRHYSSGQYQ